MLWQAGDREESESYFQQDLDVARTLCRLNPNRLSHWQDLIVSLQVAVQRSASSPDQADAYQQELQQVYRRAYEAIGSEQFKEKLETTI